MARPRNALLIYPKFHQRSFWSYEGTCDLLGAKYPAAPLGLLTLAALLPTAWNIRLVNRNTETLRPADFDWADVVMTGGMLAQRQDCLRTIELAQQNGKHVMVGGPDVTSSPQAYERADIRVLGEAEPIIDDVVAAWDSGERQGLFESPKFQADVTKTPIPRFDLMKRGHYIYPSVQFSRGCPFRCEFCDIIELYGRVPRTKTSEQMLAELDRLYELGWRGYLDFVDDNLIGNKKAVKEFLPHLIEWQKKRKYPFMLSTEASLNLSDDSQLMGLMRDANFYTVFVGIESSDEETLAHIQKKQNTRRSIPESVRRIYDFGMFVAGGFIIGFDTENGSVANPMIRCIEDSSIPMANLSLLYALAGTQLTQRLAREQRLLPDFQNDLLGNAGNFSLAAMNFEPVRPRRDILADFAEVLTRIYEPNAYFGRVRRMVLSLNRPDRGFAVRLRDDYWRDYGRYLRIIWRIRRQRPDILRHVRAVIGECWTKNPHAVRAAVTMSMFYLFLGPLSRLMVEVARAQFLRPLAQAIDIPVAHAMQCRPGVEKWGDQWALGADAGPGHVLFGPYIELPEGQYAIEAAIESRTGKLSRTPLALDVFDGAQIVAQTYSVRVRSRRWELKTEFLVRRSDTKRPYEVRLWSPGGISGRVISLRLSRIAEWSDETPSLPIPEETRLSA